MRVSRQGAELRYVFSHNNLVRVSYTPHPILSGDSGASA